MCIKPPLKPKVESCFTTFSLDCFTPAGNVVRGNQKLCMLNPYESFRP